MTTASIKEKYALASEEVLRSFSQATKTEQLLDYLKDIEVRTQEFEAVVDVRLSFTTDLERIKSPELKAGKSDADRALEAHFNSIDETDEWLEYHLGLSKTFKERKSCSCEYSEKCSTCGGSKEVTCKRCSGHGITTCDNRYCRHGRVTCPTVQCHNGYYKCYACYGSGQVDKTFYDARDINGNPPSVTRRVTCGSCGGNGRGMTCHSCHGTAQVKCSRCQGSNRIRCGTCQATGKLDCASCDALGYKAYRKTLTTHVVPELSYVGETAKMVEVLRSISDPFSKQLLQVPRRDLQHISKGKAGRHSYKGEAIYSFIKPEDKTFVFVGHLDYPAQVSQKLFEPVVKDFREMVSALDIEKLKQSDLGQEVIECMCGEEPSDDGCLQRYDKAGLLQERVAEVMPAVDEKITHGESSLRMKMVIYCSLIAFLIYLIPFQKALDGMGFAKLVGLVTTDSPWHWGAFITLWGMPLLALNLSNRICRARRKERSTEILGASRKMKMRGGFATWFGTMALQTAILAGTTFFPEPFYPKPCYLASSEMKLCIVVSAVMPYIGAPSNALSQSPASTVQPVNRDITEPRLDDFRPFMNEFRDDIR